MLFSKLLTSFLCLLLAGTAYAAPSEVLLTISIDYEGDIIDEKNIEAIRAFRQKYPTVRLIHFLNAASFTATGADKERTAQLLRSVINPSIDEIGLHIHPRKSLVEAAGVKFRAEPTYLGDADPEYVRYATENDLLPWQWPRPRTEKSTGTFGEAGDDVPFWAYEEAEQRKLIRRSLDILAQYGFTNVKSFRAGGWSASPATWRALVAEGIKIDSSAVPAKIISRLYGRSNLMHFNKQIWRGIETTTQPFKIDLGRSEILQFPNNGGLADYQSPRDFFRSFLATIKSAGAKDKPIVHIGFHLESAAQYLHNLIGGYELMAAYAAKKNLKLTSATFGSSKLNRKRLQVRSSHIDSGRACRAIFK